MTSDRLTVDEVAEELNISRMSVYRAIHDGVLKAYRHGRLYRVRRADLDEYIEFCEVDR
jgi:excisionase family DNA binding protein